MCIRDRHLGALYVFFHILYVFAYLTPLLFRRLWLSSETAVQRGYTGEVVVCWHPAVAAGETGHERLPTNARKAPPITEPVDRSLKV